MLGGWACRSLWRARGRARGNLRQGLNRGFIKGLWRLVPEIFKGIFFGSASDSLFSSVVKIFSIFFLGSLFTPSFFGRLPCHRGEILRNLKKLY
jgi:hypothetical protein